MLPNTEFKTIIDVVTRFPDEKSCHQYLASRRWNDGIMLCPHEGCGGDRAYIYKDGIRYKCCKCKRVYTAKTGTFMEASNLKSIKWFIAIYMVLHKKGISSCQLAKDIGITQKSAWFVLQRIRTALGNDSEEMLEGTVEIDEAFVGGKSRFKHKNKRKKYNPGRSWPDKTPVFGMLQRKRINSRGDHVPARVKAFAMTDVMMLTITKAVRNHVKIGSVLKGDGFTAYRVLANQFTMDSVDHSKGWYVDGDTHTNTIEGFWSQFKKGITGVYHKTTRKHLNKYVQEFTFKYNYKHLSAQQQIDGVIRNMECRLKYKDLVA
ncbi:MAG: IS1595 family transposase [Mucilaginibacter sp.]